MAEKSAEGGKVGVATLRVIDERLVNSGRVKREILTGHYRKLGVPSKKATFEKVFKEGVDD